MTSTQSIETLKQQLQDLVPEIFIEGQIDVIALKNLLGTDATLRDESYGLNWLGKSYARLLANENTRTWLKTDNSHNYKPENAKSQNLLIQGDNLEVLKHLTGAYSEKVKMIYIDPPYNTGGDGFVYEDDRKFTVEQLSSMTGINEDEAKRILEFTQAKSNSHSAWLTFMYPRLYIAKQLLRDEGVIFISIDDNEQAQLKLLCDEVFGEENFVAQFAWQKIHSTKNDAKFVSTNHEYVFLYSKKIENLNVHLLPRTDKMNERYSNPDLDPRGDWASGDLVANEERKEGYFEVTSPKTGKKFTVPSGKHWVYSQSNLADLVNQNRIWFGKNGNAFPRLKRFLSEVQQGKKVDSLWLSDDVGHNQEAKREVKLVFDDLSIFDTPKPIRLIIQMMRLSCAKDSIILDFFAGSGTTAQAVMQLNAEDEGNRQFICVQLPEVTETKSEAYKAGYKTIFEITKARIEKAAAKIKAEKPEYAGDLGFKIYETIDKPEKYLETAEVLTENLELFDASKLEQTDRHNLMRTWALEDNVPLTMDFTAVDLTGYKAYLAKHLLYFVEPNLTLDAVIKLLEQLDSDPEFKPSRLVVFGYLLDSKVQREMSEAVKHYNNRKGIELTLDVRY